VILFQADREAPGYKSGFLSSLTGNLEVTRPPPHDSERLSRYTITLPMMYFQCMGGSIGTILLQNFQPTTQPTI